MLDSPDQSVVLVATATGEGMLNHAGGASQSVELQRGGGRVRGRGGGATTAAATTTTSLDEALRAAVEEEEQGKASAGMVGVVDEWQGGGTAGRDWECALGWKLNPPSF